MNGNSIMWGVTIALCVVLLAMVLGGPVLSTTGLTWDNSTAIARIQQHERLERSRIAADERLEQARIAQQDADGARWHETARWLAVVVAAGVALNYLRGVLLRWLDRRAQVRVIELAVQASAFDIMRRRPGGRLELIDGAWWVVDDARQEMELVPVERRLTG